MPCRIQCHLLAQLLSQQELDLSIVLIHRQRYELLLFVFMNCVNDLETGIPPKRIKTSGFHVSFNFSFRKMYHNSRLPSFYRGVRYEY